MRILFMGTPDIAKESLQALCENHFEVIAVVTAPDKPKGRGMKLIPSPVKEYAEEQEIPIYQPEKIRKNEEFLEEIRKLNPDAICVVAYGKILPEEILQIPKLGCINVHPSLLPKYRGAAPIQWAVLNGDEKTGVTIMYMDAGMDTGDIITVEETTIGPEETTGELWERLSKIGAKLLVSTMKEIEKGTVLRKKQKGDFTVAPMLSKEMANICWETKTAEEIKNLVRGLNPIMGAVTYWEGKKIKFWRVENCKEEEFLEKFPEMKEYAYKLKMIVPGTILFSGDKIGLYIKTKEGILSVLEIQGENAKRMPIKDFLRGTTMLAGQIFSEDS